MRRSTRSLGKERQVYIYQVESSSSSSSSESDDHHYETSSESDNNETEYEPSVVSENEQEHEHQESNNNDNESVTGCSSLASTSSTAKCATTKSVQAVVSNCADDDDDDAESSGDETEIDGEVEEDQETRNKVKKRKQLRYEVVSLNCSECAAADFRDRHALVDHLLACHQIRQYRCSVRGCESVSFQLLKQLTHEHNKLVHGKQSDWPCALCPLAASSYENLAVHVSSHHQKGKFKCKLCFFESNNTTRNGMKRHFKHVHTAKGEHPCLVENCGKVFPSKERLIIHAVAHSTEKPFSCSQCEKCFKTSRMLLIHTKSVHQRLRPFKCNWPDCRFEASTSSAVERHAKGLHQRIRPYKCKWDADCRFSATTACAVGMHVKRVHFVAGDKRNAKDFVEKEQEQEQPEITNKRKNVNSGPNKRIRTSPSTRSQASTAQVEQSNSTQVAESDSDTEIDEQSNEMEQNPNRTEQLNFEVLSLKCSECSVHFGDKLELKDHLFANHQIRQFRCFVRGCESDSFDLNKQLTQQHNKTKHGNKSKWPCAQCTSALSSYKQLCSHVQKYHQEGRFKCKLCDFESVTTRETMVRHTRKAHPSTSVVVVATTQKKIKRKKLLATSDLDKQDKKEKATNRIVVWLNCPIDGCGQHRPNLVQLNVHILECHQIEQYRCLVRDCAQSFKYSEQYRLHKVAHDQANNALACPKCDYSTAKYSSLFYHFYLNHEEGRFACNQSNCDFVSDSCRQPMNAHSYSHRPLKYKCTVAGCSEAFKQSNLLRNHVKSHQAEVNRFSGCPHCGRTDFIRSNSFTDHVRSHARKSGGFQCAWKLKANEHCGWFSTNINAVHEHIRGQHLKDDNNSKDTSDLNKYANKVFPNKKGVKKLRKSSRAARSNAALDTDDESD